MALSLRRRGVSSTPAGGMGYEVVVAQDDLRDLVRAINQHGDKKAVRKELRDGLREAVKPIVPKARSAVKSQSSSAKAWSITNARGTGSTSGSLRSDIARSVQIKVDLGLRSSRIGVRVRLDGKRMLAHPRSLVYYYEGVKPWRHPVFGNTEKWVQQPARGFFTEVVTQERPQVLRKVQQTCEDIGRKLD